MKRARVKATGEIVNVYACDKYVDYSGRQWLIYEDDKGRTFNEKALEFNLDNSPLDYWEKLKHQYAGMAMQGMLSNPAFPKHSQDGYYKKNVVNNAYEYATALVEKLKGE